MPIIHIHNQQKKYPLEENSIQELVKAFFLFYKVPHDEVSIYFVTKAAISKIHKDFFDDPSETDCISFPMDDASEKGYKILGEVFVCPAVANEYAKAHKSTHYQEQIQLYVVHGLLHLIGYDDIASADRKIMRQHEKIFLIQLSTLKSSSS